MSGGTKHDQEKVRLDLLSPIWLFGVGQVLTFGAKKYAAHNWRRGIHLSRLLGACLRHVFSFLGGEDRDPETGLSHLYHASCCLMFAAETYELRPEMDDRWKPNGGEAGDEIQEQHRSAFYKELEEMRSRIDTATRQSGGPRPDPVPEWTLHSDGAEGTGP